MKQLNKDECNKVNGGSGGVVKSPDLPEKAVNMRLAFDPLKEEKLIP